MTHTLRMSPHIINDRVGNISCNALSVTTSSVALASDQVYSDVLQDFCTPILANVCSSPSVSSVVDSAPSDHILSDVDCVDTKPLSHAVMSDVNMRKVLCDVAVSSVGVRTAQHPGRQTDCGIKTNVKPINDISMVDINNVSSQNAAPLPLRPSSSTSLKIESPSVPSPSVPSVTNPSPSITSTPVISFTPSVTSPVYNNTDKNNSTINRSPKKYFLNGGNVDNNDTSPIKFCGKINNVMASIIIDSGANASFISEKFIKKNKIAAIPTASSSVVVLADGGEKTTNHIVLNAVLKIDSYSDKSLKFHVTDLCDVDIILGMDWLHKYNPDIDWKNSIVKLTYHGKTIT